MAASWIREKLKSSVLNSILALLAVGLLAAIFFVTKTESWKRVWGDAPYIEVRADKDGRREPLYLGEKLKFTLENAEPDFVIWVLDNGKKLGRSTVQWEESFDPVPEEEHRRDFGVVDALYFVEERPYKLAHERVKLEPLPEDLEAEVKVTIDGLVVTSPPRPEISPWNLTAVKLSRRRDGVFFDVHNLERREGPTTFADVWQATRAEIPGHDWPENAWIEMEYSRPEGERVTTLTGPVGDLVSLKDFLEQDTDEDSPD